jgi:hypothetical protein
VTRSFLYTAWFRNRRLPPEDQDYEWPACFLVTAETATEAQAWGDHLATSFASRRDDEVFLRSDIDETESGGESGSLRVPVIPCGYEATDGEIGW